MDSEWYESAFDLVRQAQDQGMAAFVLHTLESGDVRLISLSLPRGMVVRMLRDAADGYEKQAAPDGPLN